MYVGGFVGATLGSRVLSLGDIGSGGSGAKPGGTGTVLGSVRFRNISANCCSAACSLSARGERAEAGCGFWSAFTRSLAAEMAASVDEAVGIWTCDGNQASVSAMRSARVSLA